jgi:membrane associated rhomboid family serine protease
MLPLKDVIRPRRFPRLSTALLAGGTIALPLLWFARVLDAQSAILLAIHLLYLCVFADNVEDRLGARGFALVYLASHGAGSAAHLALAAHPALTVGITSGAVAGVLAAYLVLYPASRVLMLVPMPFDLHEVPASFVMAMYFLVHLAGGPPGLAHAAAGAAAGAAVCLILKRPFDW